MPFKYQHYLKPYARSQRKNSTLAEILLWNELKQEKLGYQFYRQKPLLNYIVDFYSPALRLIIEIDGNYHNKGEQQEKDDLRQKELEGLGLNFLRFSEKEVKIKRGSVVEYIEDYIREFEGGKSPGADAPPPFSKGEGSGARGPVP